MKNLHTDLCAAVFYSAFVKVGSEFRFLPSVQAQLEDELMINTFDLVDEDLVCWLAEEI